jgi:hypothetical protein
MRRRLLLTIAAIAFGIAIARVWWLRQAREQLLAFASSVRVGQSVESVVSRCKRYSRLSCRVEPKGDVFADTPLEFGAGNWIVWLAVRNGTVSAIRFRTPDSTRTRPKGAPPDR